MPNHWSTSPTDVEATDKADTLRLTPSRSRRACYPSNAETPSPSASTAKRPNRSIPSGRTQRSSSPRHYASASVTESMRPSQTGQHLSTPRRHRLPPRDWPRDEITLPSLVNDPLVDLPDLSPNDLDNLLGSGDRHTLGELANGDFSSPSTYPSFTTAHTNPPSPGQQPQSHATSTSSSSTTAPRHLRQPDSQPTNSNASESFHSIDGTSSSSHSLDDMMSGVPRRSDAEAGTLDLGPDSASSPHAVQAPKRRRISNSMQTPSRSRKAADTPKIDDDDPFADTPERGRQAVASLGDYEPYMIDLTSNKKQPEVANEEPEEQRAEDGTTTKLSAFQCAICMDDATALTVTHCGTSCPLALLPSPCIPADLHVSDRPPLLCRVPPLRHPRGDDKGPMSHVPIETRCEAACAVHDQDEGLLPPRT